MENAQPHSELSTPTLILLLHRAAEDAIYGELARAGFADLTRPQGRLLAGIDPEGTRLVVLADRARIAKQTAVSLVDRLEAAGYVERVADPLDGRARLVTLTARGRQMLPIARRAERSIEQQWRAVLGASRFAVLTAALDDLWLDTDASARRTEV